MTLPGVSSSTQLSAIQSNFQQLRKQFTQLGQDLSAGNLSQAQTDFVTLSQAAATELGSNSPIAQTLSTVGQALQSGNLSSAQQAFSTLPVGMVGPNAISNHGHSHHHGHAAFSQQLEQLGQALQSGNLSAAQQAYAALQQSWPQIAASSTSSSTTGSTQADANSLSVSA
jgi:soluble cytochrome b562